MEDLQFELLEIGLNFIASGLNHIVRATTKADLKYGVLHLASGIELVLKRKASKKVGRWYSKTSTMRMKSVTRLETFAA